jgi:cytidylate kinase
LFGRGAAALAEPGKSLRVRVIAPLEKRIAYWTKFSHVTADKARADLFAREADRAAFMKHFCGKWELDDHSYDLVLNTGELPLHACVQLVLSAYGSLFPVAQRHATMRVESLDEGRATAIAGHSRSFSEAQSGKTYR